MRIDSARNAVKKRWLRFIGNHAFIIRRFVSRILITKHTHTHTTNTLLRKNETTVFSLSNTKKNSKKSNSDGNEQSLEHMCGSIEWS